MKKNSFKSLLANLLLVVGSVVFALLLVEGITRLVSKKEFTNMIDFRRSQPAPYIGAEYYNNAFLKEALTSNVRLVNPKGTRILYPGDYKGLYFNVVGNKRFTTDQPAGFQHTIYLFGGSTMYCAEVPDSYTIASNIQRMYNLSDSNIYRVVNCGVSSINTLQQLEKLKSTDITDGDIVVFYGGVNDALLFTTGRLDGWIMGENDKEYETFGPLQKLKFKLYMKLHEHSLFVTKFFYPFSDALPSHMTEKEKVKVLQDKLYVSYMNSITAADSFCRSKGAAFYNFLQPNIATRSPNTGYERELIKNKYIISAQSFTAVKLSYVPLGKAAHDLAEQGIRSADISDVLNNSKDEHYLDYCHVTDKANKLVALAIFDKMKNPVIKKQL